MSRNFAIQLERKYPDICTIPLKDSLEIKINVRSMDLGKQTDSSIHTEVKNPSWNLVRTTLWEVFGLHKAMLQ